MYGLERGVSWPDMEVRRSTERVVGGGEQWEGNVEEKKGAVTRGLICFSKDLGLYPTGSSRGGIEGL